MLQRSRLKKFCSAGWWVGDKPQKGVDIFDAEDDKTDPSPPVARRSSLFTSTPKPRAPVVEGTPQISVAQALYLAKEAGIFTTRELQTHVIKSPSFSTNDAPHLLESFFTTAEESAAMPVRSAAATEVEAKTDELENDVVPMSVHQLLSKAPFFAARGREWLETGEGSGTRKRARAHVLIQKGTGQVIVNGKEDFYKRWPILSNRLDVLYPFEATGSAGLFDVSIAVRGGGTSGQAGAARLAVGRALRAVNPHCEEDLKESLTLSEDTRQKTSKFPGKKGAYARRNWTLR